MIKDIVKDPLLLGRKSVDATPEDEPIIRDLLDTLISYEHLNCVGIAANMIGIHKRIIAMNYDGLLLSMINPVIIGHSKETYMSTEGCLCLEGRRSVKRWRKIKVSYLDRYFRKRIRSFEGNAAAIIQHEIDHCNGIIV